MLSRDITLIKWPNFLPPKVTKIVLLVCHQAKKKWHSTIFCCFYSSPVSTHSVRHSILPFLPFFVNFQHFHYWLLLYTIQICSVLGKEPLYVSVFYVKYLYHLLYTVQSISCSHGPRNLIFSLAFLGYNHLHISSAHIKKPCFPAFTFSLLLQFSVFIAISSGHLFKSECSLKCIIFILHILSPALIPYV